MASLKWFCWIYCSCLQYRHLKQTSPIYVLWPRKCAKLDIFKLKKCCIYVWHFGVFISELKFWCLSVIMSRRTDIQCLLFLCVRLQVLQRQAKPNCTACITCAKRIWCKFVFLALLSFGELRFRWVGSRGVWWHHWWICRVLCAQPQLLPFPKLQKMSKLHQHWLSPLSQAITMAVRHGFRHFVDSLAFLVFPTGITVLIVFTSLLYPRYTIQNLSPKHMNKSIL